MRISVKSFVFAALFGFLLAAGGDALAAKGENLPGAGGETLSAVDVVLVLDNSGSMKKNDPDFLTREVVIRFLDRFEKGDRIGLVVFDQYARLAEPLVELGNLKARAGFLHKLDSIDYSGLFSDSPSAVERAIYELKSRGRDDSDHVIVLLTDGIVDTGDKTTDVEKTRWLKDELTRESEYAGIRVFGIAFTDKADFSLIQTLAIKTGGDYYRAFTSEDIQTIFARIFDSIRRPAKGDSPPATAEKSGEPSAGPAAKAAVPEPGGTTGAGPPTTAAAKQAPPPAGNRIEPDPRMPGEATETPETPTAGPTQSGIKAYLVPAALSGIAVILVIIIVIQLTNRKAIPSRAARAVSHLGATAEKDALKIQRAELLDLHGITGTGKLELNSRQIKVGRDSGNDIVIDKDTVSSLHAVIEYRDGFFYIEDQRSKNKTRLNGLEIKPYLPIKLKNGDEISFNKFKFKFILPDSIPVGETVMDFGRRPDQKGVPLATARPPEGFQQGPATMPQAILIDVKNITGRKTVNMERSVMKIGRGVHNDVVIDEDSVSGSHAAIVYKEGAFFVEDQRSTNKTCLNGEAVEPYTPKKLKSGDELMFDTFAFIFLLEHQTPAGDTNERW